MLGPSNLRTRSFYDGLDIPNSEDDVFLRNDLSPYGSAHVESLVHSWTRYSSMTDRINPIGTNGFRSPGPCESVRVRATPLTGMFARHRQTDNNFDITLKYWNHSASISEVLASLPSPSTGSVLSARQTAFNIFTTQIPADVSIANFLYELKDFKELGKHLAKGFDILKSGSHLPTKGKIKVKKIPSAANSTFLEYNFAWAPLIGDLIKLTQVADNIHRRLTFLRDNYGKVVKLNFYRPNFYGSDPSILGEVHSTYTNAEGTYNQLKLVGYKADFAAHGLLVSRLNGLDDALTGLKATWAALGLNNPAKIIWNAIPFSFIFDWINPFGHFLDRLAVQPFSGTFDVFDITSSIKEEITFEESAVLYGTNIGGNLPRITRAIQIGRYRRVLGLPLSFDDIGFTSLTSHQQQLFLSLIAGNTIFKGRH